jgi:flavodoxin
VEILIVYDSRYGHTEKIAQAMGEAIGGQVFKVGDVDPSDLEGLDLLIVGSPTHGGFPTEGINGLLKAPSALEGLQAAVFDTRTRRTIFGYAAAKMARNVEKNGANLVAPPEGFYVLGMRGPLKDGELERAAAWARDVAE